ncbi:hypothetical protein M5K25_005426 [Dendrobium thyrsiflorum]|uniref:Uncharacterized protein n=1 Tax=Dendrobium thyrsiflorum TaxID=117978 RepID=A0ABD0VHL9_DENTH
MWEVATRHVYLNYNYYGKVKGGVIRTKEQLSESHKNVAPCAKMPDMEQFNDKIVVGSYYESEHSGPDSLFSLQPMPYRGVRGLMDHYMANLKDDREPNRLLHHRSYPWRLLGRHKDNMHKCRQIFL